MTSAVKNWRKPCQKPPAGISVASWNVNGIKSKTWDKGDDPEFIAEIFNHDIVCLSETHSGPDYSINIPGYCTVDSKSRPQCKKNNRFYGGMILIVKKELKGGVQVISNKSKESILVRLDKTFFKMQRDLYVGFFYIIPSESTYVNNPSNEIDPFEELDLFIQSHNKDGGVLIMGDLNARVSQKPDFIVNDQAPIINGDEFYETDVVDIGRCSEDTQNNTQGNRLLETCIGNKMRILNGRTLGDLKGKYTCHRPGGSSVVDYGLVNEDFMQNVNFFKIHDFNGQLSDHCKICVQIRGEPQIPKKPESNSERENDTKKPKGYRWDSEASATRFIEQLQSTCIINKLDSLTTNIDHSTNDDTITKLNEILNETADLSLKRKPHKSTKRKRKSYKKWYDEDCESIRRNLKALGKKLQRQPSNNSTRQIFYKEKKRYKKLVKYKRKQYRQECVSKLEHSINSQPKEYWNTLNDLKNDSTIIKDTTAHIPMEEWTAHFSNLHSKPHDDDHRLDQAIHQEESIPYFSSLDFPITELEVKKAIHGLKSKKAPGYDMIMGEMVKAGKETLTPCLTKLFNSILSSKQYPQEWNRGIITPIHKKGSRVDPNNYRGITVNSVLAKVYSTVLCKRLETYIEEHKILHDTQIGFKKEAQIADHIFVIQSLAEKYSDNKKLYMCFIDFEKAYDSVWRKGLLLKLLKQNIRGLFYHQIKAMYDNVLVSVKQSGTYSNFFKSMKGVKQGEVLSPLLFNLFINDINNIFSEACDPVSLNGRKIPCLQYADDLILLSESKQGLQESLDRLNSYCEEWKLKINVGKSKAMVVSKGSKVPKDHLSIGNKQIEYVNHYTYLGVPLSNNGKYTTCKRELTNKARKAMYKLKGLLWGTNLKKSIALKMFDQLVLPIITYGAEIWTAPDLIKLSTLSNTSTLEDLYDKIPQEKLNIHYSKFVLGVSSKSTNLAAMGELGRFPIFIKAIVKMIKYYARIRGADPQSLIGQAFIDMEHRTSIGKMTWTRSVENIISTLGLDSNQICADICRSAHFKKKTGKLITKLLEDRYSLEWRKQLQTQTGKLDTYKHLKTDFGYEKYLDCVKTSTHQQALTRLRISNHSLHIETGRYKRPKTPRDKRICNLCNEGVEDEYHFLFKCKAHNNLRVSKFGHVEDGESDIATLTRFVGNFSALPASCVASFIAEAMASRKQLL
jgi:exonuclease III